MKFFYLFLLFGLIASCNVDKVSCDMQEGIELNQYNLKQKLTKMLALKYASEDYKDSKKGFWEISFTEEYKKYLKKNLDDAENEVGKYYEQATEILADDSILIERIIPLSYDKEVNKCECEATMKIKDTEIEDKIKYDITRDSKGELVGHYAYKPAIKIDKEDYDYIVFTLKNVSYEPGDFEPKRQQVSLVDKDESWKSFWLEFKSAYHDKNMDKLVSLSSSEFFSGGSGEDASGWFSYIFNDAESYTSIAKALSGGVQNNPYRDGVESKVTGDGEPGELYFDFKNGHWLFGGLVGD